MPIDLKYSRRRKFYHIFYLLTTAFYIQDSLKNTNVKSSKLAQGLPVGGEIETSDDGTLISAFKNRRDL